MLQRLEETGCTSRLQRYRDEIDLSDQRIDMQRDVIKEPVRRGVVTDVSENGGHGEESTG
jgi:hypothetical protein